MFTSNRIFPIPALVDFLSSTELAQLSQVNRTIHSDTKNDLVKRKKISIIKYFLTDNNRITIRTKYDENYERNVLKLFTIIPELFEYIQVNNILSLDLSCVTSYGGYPENPYKLISPNKDILLDVLEEIINLLKLNTTLTYCNIGLLEWIIDRDHLQLSMQNHPTITCVSIRSNGASTNFNEPPNSLYRLSTGEFIWSHFRPN